MKELKLKRPIVIIAFAVAIWVFMLSGIGRATYGNYATANDSTGIYVLGNYAYLTEKDSGLHILDVSDPSTPSLKGTFDTSGSANGVFVSGHHAYIADGLEGLCIIDITDPANPAHEITYDTPGYAYDVFIFGNYAYIADGIEGLQIIDVTDPANPSYKGSYRTPGYACDVYVLEKYAYVADDAEGLQIIDVSIPDAPVYKGSYNTAPDWATGVSVLGNYAYITTHSSAVPSSSLIIVNISDPSNPHYEDTLGYARKVCISENHVYIADYHGGLHVIDASDPINPTYAGRYETSGWALDVFVCGDYAYVSEGVWGDFSGLEIFRLFISEGPVFEGSYATVNDPYGVYVVGNYAYVADRDAGLQILDISDPTAPFLKGTFDTPGSANGVHVSGNYAYIADGLGGLSIINVSDPANPDREVAFNTRGYAHDVFISGNYVYVANGTSGLYIVEVSDPANPLGDPFLRRGYYDTPGYAFDVCVSGKYAYVADDAEGLQIIDVSIPDAPVYKGSYNTAPDWATGVSVIGNYAYITTHSSAVSSSGLIILDISDPANPVHKATYSTPRYAKDIYISGHCAYIADYYGGLHVIDISDPNRPTYIGECETSGPALDVFVCGNYAYVCEGVWGDFSGIEIFKISTSYFQADFTAVQTTLYGEGEYEVRFTDRSTGTVTTWLWDFGDGETSEEQNPVHIYSAPGIYTVTLTVTSPGGITSTIIMYVMVEELKLKWVGSYDAYGLVFDVCVSRNYNYSNYKQIAYVAAYNGGFHIIDVTDPSRTHNVAQCYTKGAALGVSVLGDYAYVASATSNDGYLGIFDISRLAYLEYVGEWNANAPAHDVFIAQKDSETGYGETGYGKEGSCETGYGETGYPTCPARSTYAYVAADHEGLFIVDVSNPTAPVSVGSYDTPGLAVEVFVAKNYNVSKTGHDYAYVADWDRGLQIIDVEDPTSPELVGNYDTLGVVQGVFVSGNYAYVTDSQTQASSATYSRLLILNIKNPASPKYVASYFTLGWARKVFVAGNYAYIAEYDYDGNSDVYGNVLVVDISDPYNPTFLAGRKIEDVGAISVFVFENHVYVGEKGLEIYNMFNSWPITTGASVKSSPAIADLDGDGKLETVVAGSGGSSDFGHQDDGRIHAWHSDGRSFDYDGDGSPEWPKITENPTDQSPAIADLDGDGTLEVVTSGGTHMFGMGWFYGSVYAWHSDSSQGWEDEYGNVGSMHYWPKWTEQVTTSPAIGDLDGDGTLEVVTYSKDGFIHAWHYNDEGHVDQWGNHGAVNGWPINVVGLNEFSPTIADLDGDGKLEVIVCAGSHSVYAWHFNGTPVSGWPKMLTWINGEPAIADLDGDGTLEVIVSSYCNNDGSRIYAWHFDGTLVEGWPKVTAKGEPDPAVVADLDGDGTLEVIVSSYYINDGSSSIHAWHSDPTQGYTDEFGNVGTTYGWPKTMIGAGKITSHAPAVADLDGNGRGDGDLEVIVALGSYVYAWHGDACKGYIDKWGNFGAVEDFPKKVGVIGMPQGQIYSSPAVADIDGDGRLEVVVTSSDGRAYALVTSGIRNSREPWPMFRHDPKRTGLYYCAAFTTSYSRKGRAPFAVKLEDMSVGDIKEWEWDFGDGEKSTSQNPIHIYSDPGTYTVSLKVTWREGTDVETEVDYITVLPPLSGGGPGPPPPM